MVIVEDPTVHNDSTEVNDGNSEHVRAAHVSRLLPTVIHILIIAFLLLRVLACLADSQEADERGARRCYRTAQDRL